MRATIRIPATSANLGSGFDTLGIALALYNRVIVEDTSDVSGPMRPPIVVRGEGSDELPRDERNLIYQTILKFFQIIDRPVPPFALETRNLIPLSGGLGSSSAALVGGLLAGNFLAGTPLSRDEVLRIAHDEEGHPDNVAPALMGGLVLCVADGDRLTSVALPVPFDLHAVLFIPDFAMPTETARRLLPKEVPHGDAVFNVGRAALLIAAFQTGQLELLRIATEDRLHQPYRREMFPAMPRLLSAAMAAGALGSCLSGAGSALLALARGREAEIAEAFRQAAAKAGVPGRTVVVDVDRQGAQVEVDQERVGDPVFVNGDELPA